MNTASLFIFLVISSVWFCGVKDCWISSPIIDWVKSELEGALRYIESFFTWLDSEGLAFLGTCKEYEAPDRDLYYPDVQHCVKLSDRFSSIADVLLDYWASIVLFILTASPDTSCLLSVSDIFQISELWEALKGWLSCSTQAVESHFIYVGSCLQYIYQSALSQTLALLSCGQSTDWFKRFTSDVVLFNKTSLTLIITVSCLALIYVVCYLLSDTDFAYTSKKVTFSADNSKEDSSRRRAERLARIRPTNTAKKDKDKRKKRQRKRPASHDTSTDQDSCSFNSFSPRPGSENNCVSHMDDEALRYIVGGAADTSSEDLKERILAALQVLACHEDQECNKKSGREGSNGLKGTEGCPGTVECDIRYKDNLPTDVMDVLFCIDPKCEHDHGRYELRGCKVLVKPADYKKYEKRSKAEFRKSSDNQKTSLSARNKSPVDSQTWAQSNKLTDDNSKHQDSDPSVERADSFPDWTAPAFDQCCPYCKMAERKKKGEVSGEEEDVYSGDLTSDSTDESLCNVSLRRPHSHDVSGPNPRRPQPELIELLGEAALEQVIGPPQANSSFQAEDEITCPKFPIPSSKKYINSMDNSSPECFRPRKRGVAADWSPNFNSKKKDVRNFAYTGSKRRPNVEPIITPIQRVGVKQGGTPGRGDTSNENDSVPTFNEAELSLTRELQDSFFNESHNSIDLAELNRSLSFYGDVSMVELAASWIVNNILDRAKNVFSQVKIGILKDSVMDISTGVMETLDLLE